MMRDIYLGVRLPFDTEADREHSEDILMWLLGTICRLNLLYLSRHPNTPPLYDSGVVYAPPDQLSAPQQPASKLQELQTLLDSMGLDAETSTYVRRLVQGAEVFLDIPSLYRRGKGDCNELVPVRIAELWRVGIYASPFLTREANSRGGWTYHAVVKWRDGSIEDPSLILGMGGSDRAADRKREIWKNRQRFATYMAAAKRLIQAEGAPPDVLGRYIDGIGLLPRSGSFRRSEVLGQHVPGIRRRPRNQVSRAA